MNNYHVDKEYIKLLEHILENGNVKTDRTGTGTKSVFGYQMRFDLEKGFPLLTTKKVALKSIIHELIWFLRGDTNIKYLVDNNVGIWNEWPFKAYLVKNNLPVPTPNSEEWNTQIKEYVERIKTDENFAKEFGELGPVYGRQWRKWENKDGTFTDQIANVIKQIKNSSDSRRMIACAWNPGEIEEMAKAGLPPCHCLFQFYVADGKLSCQLYQRSCDTFLGVPFNIASYALLTMIIAQICGLGVKDFVWTGGDVHLYNNHFEQAQLQISRKENLFPMPTMKINPELKIIDDIKFEDFELVDYQSHEAIKAPIAV